MDAKRFRTWTLPVTALLVMTLIGVAQSEEPVPPTAEPTVEQTPKVVERAVFTTAVVDHEPIDELETLDPAEGEITFFTELMGVEGEVIDHRWFLDGELVAEVPIEVGGPRWRAYSTKTLLANWTGELKVEVANAAGDVLHEASIALAPTPDPVPASAADTSDR